MIDRRAALLALVAAPSVVLAQTPVSNSRSLAGRAAARAFFDLYRASDWRGLENQLFTPGVDAFPYLPYGNGYLDDVSSVMRWLREERSGGVLLQLVGEPIVLSDYQVFALADRDAPSPNGETPMRAYPSTVAFIFTLDALADQAATNFGIRRLYAIENL